MDRILEAPEPTQLRHRVDSTRRKVFLVGEHVPDEWLLPGEGDVPAAPVEAATDAGPDSVDWDASEDAVPVEVTTAAAEDAVVTYTVEASDFAATVDLSGSVVAVEEQVRSLPEAEQAAAAEWAMKQERLSRAPRQSLMTAMTKIVQGSQ